LEVWRTNEAATLTMENCTGNCEQNYILYLPQDQVVCEILKEDTIPCHLSQVVGVELTNQWSSCYLSNGGKAIGTIL
jgi:hypothetical protein